jgi:hypothetical protein
MLILFLHRIATISQHHPSNPFVGNRSWSNAEIRQLNRFVPESITLNQQLFHSFYVASKFTFVTVVNKMASDFSLLQQILLIAGSNSKVWAGYWPSVPSCTEQLAHEHAMPDDQPVAEVWM